MPLTPDQHAEADRERIANLSAQSTRDDAVYVELVYLNKYVRFDVSALQVTHLTPDQLVERCLRRAFEDVGLALPAAESASAS